MANIRTLIVDDELESRNGIRMLLESEQDIEILGECTNGKEAVKAIQKHQPDLVFMDVQMPVMNGFEVLQTVPTHGPPFVIFVTAHDCYALSAIRVHAVGYLLKPFSNRRFYEALQHARMQIQKQKMVNKLSRNLPRLIDRLDREAGKSSDTPDYLQRISLKDGGRITFLRVSDIDWIEAADNYVSLHCNGRSYLLRGTLSAMEKKLNPDHFLRIHRSRIVNVNKIKEMKPLGSGDCRVTLEDGTALISSRTYSKQRRQALNFLS